MRDSVTCLQKWALQCNADDPGPTVHLDRDGNATTFHVHGGGLVISRMVNEFGIAKKVAATIEESFGTPPAS